MDAEFRRLPQILASFVRVPATMGLTTATSPVILAEVSMSLRIASMTIKKVSND